MVNYFIVTKPLQYFTALNIAVELKEKTSVIITDSFFKAEEFVHLVRESLFWSEVFFVENLSDAYSILNSKIVDKDFLFVDSDYGVKNFLYHSRLWFKKVSIYVYEEGIGSYRDDLNVLRQESIFSKVFDLIVKRHYYGGSFFTKGIYLYEVEKHKKLIPNFNKERYQLRGFIENLELFKFHLGEDYGYSGIYDRLVNANKKKLVVYLTSWRFNAKILEYLEDKNDSLIMIKPHPHIKEVDEDFIKHFHIALSSDVLFELFILNVLGYFEEIIVYHEGSSSCHYLRDLNIKFKRI